MSDNAQLTGLCDRFRGFYPVVIDVETAGFNAKTDALLEIAAITLKMDEQGWLMPDTTLHFHVEPFVGSRILLREQMRYPVDVYTGKIQAYPEGKPSAIAKIQVDGELMLTDLGLEGDEQAEKKIHGGPDRALCHYPREHYLYWAREFPEQAELFVAPALGENLSTDGLTESNVYIGDIFRWGEALIQVSQPRSPCYKLNYHFDISDIAQLMQNTGKVGWLYSVIAPGLVSADAPLELVSRVSDVTVQEAAAIAWHMPFDDDQYHRLLSAAGLSKSWTRTMQKRRLSGKIEDFSRRLWGK